MLKNIQTIRTKRNDHNSVFVSKALLAVFLLACLGGCTHPETPAGHEGYVFHKPLIFGKAEYRQTLSGPSSTGLSWRLFVINVDMRTKSYKEDFQLLSKDNLSVSFEVNTRISLRPESSKEVVEEWGGENWFEWNVKEPLRTVVRREVTQVSAVEIQLTTNKVRNHIQDRLLELYKDSPIQIESVDIGNIQFPQAVTHAIEQKIGQQQELKRQEFLLAMAKKEAAIRVLESLRAAKQQMIISETLNPLYVQRMAVDVYRKLAASPNKTIVMLPSSTKGTGMPIVLASAEHKKLSPEDKLLLKEMEDKYMRIAKEQDLPTDDLPAPITAKPPGRDEAEQDQVARDESVQDEVKPEAKAPLTGVDPDETEQ